MAVSASPQPTAHHRAALNLSGIVPKATEASAEGHGIRISAPSHSLSFWGQILSQELHHEHSQCSSTETHPRPVFLALCW